MFSQAIVHQAGFLDNLISGLSFPPGWPVPPELKPTVALQVNNCPPLPYKMSHSVLCGSIICIFYRFYPKKLNFAFFQQELPVVKMQ